LPAQQPAEVAGALAAGSYFPLEVGDRWVYRADNRIVTGGYETWRIDRTEEIDGNPYYVVGIFGANGAALGESKFRVAADGNIFVRSGNSDQLFLNPHAGGGGVLTIGGAAGSYQTAVGTFNDTLTYVNTTGGLLREMGQLARGVGLLWSSTSLLTGSSGGFTNGRVLVEAVVGGGTIRFTATAGLHLGMERLTLDVTGKQVSNCILPCYFAACGLGGGIPDPPGTYKPCARARVSLENWPVDASRTVHLRLVAPDGTVLYDRPFTIDPAAGDVPVTAQIPLYSAANQPYDPGAYQLTASTDDGTAQSAVTVRLK
jgi:hypothetical protein